MKRNTKLVLTYCERSLAIAEVQFYLKSRGQKDITIPKIFQAIQEEDYMIICNLIIFAIKSVNPSVKMFDVWADLKFAQRNEVTSQLINLINRSMPENDEEDKKKEITENQVEEND